MRDLRAVIGTIVGTTLAGCHGGWPTEGDGWELPTCTHGAWTPLAELIPATTPDGIERVEQGPQTPASVVEGFGTMCATASDPVACAEEVAALERDPGLITTLGDEVEQWSGEDRIRAFLGDLDDPTEALMLPWSLGDLVVCGDLDQSAMRVSPDGGFDLVTLHYRSSCPIVQVFTLRHVGDDGGMDVVDDKVRHHYGTCAGRRPPGLEARSHGSGWLAHAAELEAASVVAFEQLAVELEALGAPAELVARAREAADDERRHAAVVGSLARRHGSEPLAPVVAPTPPRELLAVCLDNAVEGCVREAWGALIGAWQASTATDGAVRSAMDRIAADEARHAELSFAIAAWSEPRLTADERVQVAEARRDAIRTLRAEVRTDPGDVALGLPPPSVAQSLLASLERQMWA